MLKPFSKYSAILQHLRLPFFWLLLPIYLFGIWVVAPVQQPTQALALFFILHFLVYPSSNLYNSTQDRDTDSIGGVERPLTLPKNSVWVAHVLDALALMGAYLFLSAFTVWGILLYIVCSRLYSYRGVRLKRYPYLGYAVVVANQGVLVYLTTIYCASSTLYAATLPTVSIAALLIGAFYPITQIYQHRQDAHDGVATLSSVLGIEGTFRFTAVCHAAAMLLLAYWLLYQNRSLALLPLALFFAPVFFYFITWWRLCQKDASQANFRNTMRMSIIAATCTNLAFITLILITYFG